MSASNTESPGMKPQFDPFAGPALLRTAPSTESQRELWTACSLSEEASLAFNESGVLTLEGPLDVQALRGALDDLAERHEALRTTFSPDGLTLCVSAPGEVVLSMVDLSGLDAAKREDELQRQLVTEVETPFALETGPLMRVRLVRLGDELHKLVFTAHHIVDDGWSSAVLMRDLGALYTRRCGGQGELPPAIAFSDYSLAEAAAVGTPEHLQAEAYWLQQFDGEIPTLDLPSDRPRPAFKTYASRREDVAFDAELVRDLKRMGARARASFFSTLLAGFQALLYRLSGQTDVVVGIPAAGQSVGGYQNLVGHCVNTLAIRAKFDPTVPFSTLLNGTRATMLDAFEHQQYTYGSLLRKLPIPRDPSRLPLVSVLFNLDQAVSPGDLSFHRLRATLASNPRRFENFDIFVNAVESKSGVALEVQYNVDLFDASTIRRWLGCYERLLRGTLANPDCRLEALPLLSDEDRLQLASWNATEAEYPRGKCLDQLVMDQVAQRPESIAVEYRGASMTFGQLDRRSNQLARLLRQRGAARGTFVGLCMDRSPSMLVALLGVIKAGATYVPLDPAFPRDRLEFMQQDSGMPILVAESSVKDAVMGFQGSILWLDEESASVDAAEDGELPRDELSARTEDPAYVIYTSGSTGKPKGVQVPHRAVVNFLWSMREAPGLSEQDRLAAVTTLSFDISVLELFLPLVVGARIILVDKETAGDGSSLARLLTESGATVMQATPSTWQMLFAADWRGFPGFKALCGGEALPLPLAKQLAEAVGGLWNMYGPTETTVWSATKFLAHPVERVTLGRPIANTQLYVLDALLSQTPVGVPGELHIGGDGVALGYLRREELTAERFITDPFRPGGVLYKTGDLARFRSDGELEYLGRNDFQVKVRGFRIELGEIETVLMRDATVDQAVVVARELQPGDTRLIAYLRLAGGAKLEEAALRDFLRQALPEYMVPQHFVVVSAYPLTPNGKIDRKALPSPKIERAASEYVEPRTREEQLVAALWQEALGIPRVSVHDNFFQLGGHSLLASQVSARLRRDHGVIVPFRKFFEAPTIERFAALIAGTEQASESGPARIPRRGDAGGRAPLTIMQQRLVVLEEMQPHLRAVHRLGSAFRLRGNLDHEAMRRSIERIVERHDALRTVVEWEDGVPTQRVVPATRLELPIEDWSTRPTEERESALVPHLRAGAREPHDLSKSPAFDARLIRLDEREHVLYFRTHNAVWDGWSFDIFRRELNALYTEHTGGQAATLPELPISYADFAVWHRDWLRSPEIERQTEYWKQLLAGAPPALELATDFPRGDNQTFTGTTIHIRFTRAEADELAALGRNHEATLFMVLLAGFEALLHRYTGQQQILIGTPIQGRGRTELENLIGLFVNHVALRATVKPDEAFEGLVVRTRDMTLDAISHQEMPFELLGRHAPVLRAFFSLQDARERVQQLGDLGLEQIQAVSPGGSADIILWFMEQKDDLIAALNYRTDLFEAQTMVRFLEHYRELMLAALRRPDSAVAELPIMPAPEARRVQALGTKARTSSTRSWLEDFAAYASASPAAVAVEMGGTRLTYGQLAHRASNVAAAVRALELPTGSPVAVGVERSPNLPAAIIGVLAAGMACVPVELADNAKRTSTILEEFGVAAVVTDARTRDQLPAVRQALVEVPENVSGSLDPLSVASVGSFILPGFDESGRTTGQVLSLAELQPLTSAAEELRLQPKDVVLGLASATTGNGIAELVLSLGRGARLVLAEDTLTSEPDRIPQALARCGATVLIASPSALNAVAAGAGEATEALPICCVCSPAPLSQAEAAAVLPKVKELWTAWGPTADGVWTALGRVETATQARAAHLLAGATVRVLDARGELCALDVPGELVLDRGDVHSEARSAHSGVRVRWRNDETLEWLGRCDERVLIGDRLVDPAETLAVLKECGSLADAAVIGQEDRGQWRMVAYVVAKQGAEPTPAELRRLLRGRVREATMPSAFVVLPELPRSEDGRLVKASLPSLAQLHSAARAQSRPRTATEQTLVDAWRDLLRVEPQLHDNFFDLGGHSLLATVLVHRLEQTLGRRIGLRELMFQTLEQIAQTIDGAAAAAARAT
jgi:amino acid adenylation domain-containing protein